MENSRTMKILKLAGMNKTNILPKNIKNNGLAVDEVSSLDVLEPDKCQMEQQMKTTQKKFCNVQLCPEKKGCPNPVALGFISSNLTELHSDLNCLDSSRDLNEHIINSVFEAKMKSVNNENLNIPPSFGTYFNSDKDPNIQTENNKSRCSSFISLTETIIPPSVSTFYYDSDKDPEFIPFENDKSRSPNVDSFTESVISPASFTDDTQKSPSQNNECFTATSAASSILSSNIQRVRNSAENIIKDINLKLKPKRIRQRDFCFFCESEVLNFARHLKRNHMHEIEVQRIFSHPTKSKIRKGLLTALRKKGNYLINSEKCVKPMKTCKSSNLNKFLPCTYCLGFYSAKLIWKHRKTCSENLENKSLSQVEAQNFLIKHLRVSENLKENIFPRMRADNILCAFAERYIKIHREKHFVNVASRKMRELAKILIQIKILEPKIKNLFDSLQPKYFDLFVKATKNVAKFDPSNETFKSPTFAMNIGTSLKQCCDIAILHALKRKETYASIQAAEAEADFKTMIHLFTTQWRYEISSQAADDLNIQKWNKITLVPLAADLKLLKEYLVTKANSAIANLKKNNNDEVAYNDLLETVYCRVILLNRKRPGELQRLPLYVYEKSEENNFKNYEEFSEAVSETEKFLMKKFKRIVIRGKRGRGVPVLFTEDVQKHITLLLKYRANFVNKQNPHLFGKPNLLTPLCGYKILKKHASASGAKNPSAITCTKLRKHLATLTQLFNMTDSEIEQLATFMGHTPGIHKKAYRLPDDVYQTAKISKLLILMEKGAAAMYKGKALDEIDIDLEENLLNEDDNQSEDSSEEQDFMTSALDTEFNLEQSDLNVSSKEITKSKTPSIPIRNKRQLIPWTAQQKKLVSSYFQTHIKNKIAPKKHECEAMKQKYPDTFTNKTWLKIKVYVQNQYKKK